MALVVVPTAALVVTLAYSLYASALADLEATQATSVKGRAASVRAFLDAAGRSLANEAFAARYLGPERCAALAEAFLRRNSGFSSVRFFDETSAPCEAGASADAALLPPDPDAPQDKTDYRLHLVGRQIWIAAAGEGGSSLLVVDEAGLRQRLLALSAIGQTHVALTGEGGALVATDPASKGEQWAPAAFPGGAGVWRAADRGGQVATFAWAAVEGSPFGLIMRFDDRRLAAAQRRLAILCLTQLAMLGGLAFVYLAALRRDVVRWIQGIDGAARARDRDPESPAKAPVTSGMPRELRSVAESFNTMTEHAVERAHALRVSLGENRALMLEMHHRIKNSLQVIQSYLALIRRSAARPEAVLLSRIEARVGVLAVAYRLALTPNGIHPINAKPFLEEICAAAVGGLRKPRQRVTYAIDWSGELVVDRAIPLGLGLVEALIAALGAMEAGYTGVRMTQDQDGSVLLTVESDVAPAEAGLPEKVMRGLANQLGAEASAHGGGEILSWRFHP